ncbi:MAG: outer rane efflux protein [Labilithrix sp.]|nr:outer rane efflux protein [Labilithrix sp.]
MEDAIRLALATNERAQKTGYRVETAEGQLDRARTAFYPSLTASGSGVWRSTEDGSGRNITESGALTLSQPILTPSAFPQYSQSRHQLESEKWGAAQDRRVLAFDTARAFLTVLTAERVLEAAGKRLDRAQANIANAKARAEAGLNSTNDVTRAQVELGSSLREVAQGQGSVARAHTNLSFLVGKRIDQPLAAPDRTTQSAQRFDAMADAQVKAAVERRPDVKSAAERTEALRMSAKEPLYRLIPTLQAQGQMRFVPDAAANQKAVDETVTLNLSWNIFDQGARYADRRTRLAQAESQALDEKLLRRSVANDVELAAIALRAARESLTIADGQVQQTVKLTEETDILYKQGLASALEVTDAISKRFDAEVSQASARLSMEQAYLELRYALGLGPIDEDLPK